MEKEDLVKTSEYKNNVKKLKEKSQLACEKISGMDCKEAINKANNVVKKILGK